MFKIESLKVCCPFIHSHDNKNNANSDKVLKYIHRVYSYGVEGRKSGRLHLRVYNVQCPNASWRVDGFSRLCVALKCLNNNKANTLLQCFVYGVRAHGLPSRVRSDNGLENVNIAQFMIEKRGRERGSIITGKSTHYQNLRGCGEMSLMVSCVSTIICFTSWKSRVSLIR